jgi:hydroxymethylglutaryl-CoA reductase (NADPH)
MKKNDDLPIPMRTIGPIKIVGTEINAEVKVPLATFESPVWHTVNRGAKVTKLAGGINAVILRDIMTRSILLEAPTATEAVNVAANLKQLHSDFVTAAATTSRFVQFQEYQVQVVANLIYLRLAFTTGDAAGHNMTTKAATAIQTLLLQNFPTLKYVSISGNYCVDKKVSAVNPILGRGKHVIAEVIIPRQICIDELRATPEKIVDLNVKKNLVGSIIAGGVNSANAHFANMLLAFYLATGQDAANIVEGSQGITYAEIRDGDLYFSVTLPNIIVGTVGASKNLDFTQENLRTLGCLDQAKPGANSRRLAIIAAATVLCGELSLLSAQTNPGELIRSHELLER